MDIKRMVLWVVFSMSLILLWDNWMRFNGKPSLFSPSSNTVASKPVAGGNANAVPAPSAAGAVNATATPATTVALKSETVTITTDLFKADIDTRGGEIRHLELLQHHSGADKSFRAALSELFGSKQNNENRPNVALFDQSPQRTYLAQSGLVGGAGGVSGDLPNHKTVFAALPGTRVLGDKDQLQLVMEAEQNGVKLTKTFTFKKGDYVIGIRHTIANTGTTAVNPSLYVQLLHDGTKPQGGSILTGGTQEFYAPAVYTAEDHFQKLDFSKIEKGEDKHATKANNGWVAMLQHFFVSAFILPEKAEREIFTKKVDTNLYAVGSIMPIGTIQPNASSNVETRLYAGPQTSAILEKVEPGLDLVKDYGVLTVIAQPLFWLMDLIHKLVGNWGWTIILLTITIKLALFPLSAAGFKSMAKMKVLTPKMQALRERHKDEPQKLNQAMMELYKTEKINPLGGCLPVLLPMPVFFALYWVLQASVEMRGAPWMGWITDLTAPDPLFILPIIYAISTFVTTKLNPAPADPTQAKMMTFMPIMFSVMFAFFPSGLVLYWVVNSIISIGQQWIINNKLIPKTA